MGWMASEKLFPHQPCVFITHKRTYTHESIDTGTGTGTDKHAFVCIEHVMCRLTITKRKKDSSVKTTYRYSVIKINDKFLAQWKWYKPNRTELNWTKRPICGVFKLYSIISAVQYTPFGEIERRKSKVVKLCQYTSHLNVCNYLIMMEQITVNIRMEFLPFEIGWCDTEIRFSWIFFCGSSYFELQMMTFDVWNSRMPSNEMVFVTINRTTPTTPPPPLHRWNHLSSLLPLNSTLINMYQQIKWWLHIKRELMSSASALCIGFRFNP